MGDVRRLVWLSAAWGLVSCLFWFAVEASAQPSRARLQLDSLAVTNGLIRWWPNLFEAFDEITQTEGVVMGILPSLEDGAADETEFCFENGWVQLRPAISNEIFTLSFWLNTKTMRAGFETSVLMAQEASDTQWFLYDPGSASRDTNFSVGVVRYESMGVSADPDWGERIEVSLNTWHHFALCRRPDGTSSIWVDGVLARDGRVPTLWPKNAHWLSVGNCAKGDQPFCGFLRDLCVYDRVLTDVEIANIFGKGLPFRPSRNTASRLTANLAELRQQNSTNLSAASAAGWLQRTYTVDEGLPGNRVKALLQARNGYLWVGTEDGLARFDGRQFRTFTPYNTPALRDVGHAVWSLCEEPDGTIWAGVFGGLIRIRGTQFDGFAKGLPQRFVLQVQPAGNGTLWVAGFRTNWTRGPGWVRRYHPESATTSDSVVIPGHIRRMLVSSNGLWFATEQPDMLSFWDGHSANATIMARLGFEPGNIVVRRHPYLREAQLRTWDDKPGGLLWADMELPAVGLHFGWLWKKDRPLRHWQGRWAGEEIPGERWLAASSYLGRVTSTELEKITLPPWEAVPDVSSACANAEGGVWVGSEQTGLHLYQERLLRIFTTKDGLFSDDVRSLAATPEGRIWVGTDGGLNLIDEGRVTGFGHGPVRSVLSDPQGTPWLGHQGYGRFQISCCDAFPGVTNAVDVGVEWQDPNTLLFARSGLLWVVCERGLSWIWTNQLLRQASSSWTLPASNDQAGYGRYGAGLELPTPHLLGAIEDSNGGIWLGSLDAGLFQVRGKSIQRYGAAQGLPAGRCIPVYRDDVGRMWLVSDEGLICQAGERFLAIGPEQGLPSVSWQDLLQDDQRNFWVTSRRGIYRLLKAEVEEFLAAKRKQLSPVPLSARRDIATLECSSLHYPTMAKTSDGHIWVATRSGVLAFDPQQIRSDNRAVPTSIEEFVVNRHPMSVSGSGNTRLKLKPGSGSRLEFQYSAVSLLAADSLRFRYRLEGYDSDWSPPTEMRLAFYTNLRPGDYCFFVQAANALGAWTGEPATLRFSIAPHFWQTLSFQVGLLAALLGLVATIHFRRLAVQKRIQHLQHSQELHAEKSRISADMHDELGAALTQITILSEVAERQLRSGVKPESTLGLISEAAREVTTRMSHLVWSTNPVNDTLGNLATYIREHAARTFEHTQIQPRLSFPEIPSERHVSPTFRRNLILIAREALNNVVKHSQAKTVTVSLEVRHNSLDLRIQDDGRGFDPQDIRAGNGFSNIRRRSSELGGECVIEAVSGKGTTIQIRVPLTRASEA